MNGLLNCVDLVPFTHLVVSGDRQYTHTSRLYLTFFSLTVVHSEQHRASVLNRVSISRPITVLPHAWSRAATAPHPIPSAQST